MSFSKLQRSFSSNFESIFSVMKDNFSVLVVTQILYILVKRSPLKCNFLRLLSAWVKIYQTSHINFETTGQFIFKLLSFLSVITHNFSEIFQLMHFLLWTKRSHQRPNFETFKCCLENLSNFPCHFPDHKSVFLRILHDYSMS